MYCIQVSVYMSLYTLHPKPLIFCRNNSSFFTLKPQVRLQILSWWTAPRLEQLHDPPSKSTVEQRLKQRLQVKNGFQSTEMHPQLCEIWGHYHDQSPPGQFMPIRHPFHAWFFKRTDHWFNEGETVLFSKIKKLMKMSSWLDAALHEDLSNHMWQWDLATKMNSDLLLPSLHMPLPHDWRFMRTHLKWVQECDPNS